MNITAYVFIEKYEKYLYFKIEKSAIFRAIQNDASTEKMTSRHEYCNCPKISCTSLS